MDMIISGGVRYRPEDAEALGLEPDPAPKPVRKQATPATTAGVDVEALVAAKVAEALAGLPDADGIKALVAETVAASETVDDAPESTTPQAGAEPGAEAAKGRKRP